MDLSERTLYVKDKQTVLVDTSFIYETCVYLYHKGYFSLINSKFYSSPKEINGVVESFFIKKNVEICSELFAAPEQWLIDNQFTRYVKPTKMKKVTNKVKNKGNGK